MSYHVVTATTVSSETIQAAEIFPLSAGEVAPPTTIIQTPVIIEPAPVQDMPSTPLSQSTVTTIATITLPVQTISTIIPTEEANIVPLIPTEDPTVQILSLDANIMEEAAEVLDPSTLNVTEDIPEISLNTSKNTSFE